MILMATVSISFAQSNRPPIIPEGVEETLWIPHTDEESDVPEESYFGGVLLPVLTQAIIGLAAGLGFLFMIVGGIQILTAYGNEERIAAGKKTMTFAVVGLLIALLSYAIVSIISSVQITQPQSGNPQQQQQQ